MIHYKTVNALLMPGSLKIWWWET